VFSWLIGAPPPWWAGPLWLIAAIALLLSPLFLGRLVLMLSDLKAWLLAWLGRFFDQQAAQTKVDAAAEKRAEKQVDAIKDSEAAAPGSAAEWLRRVQSGDSL